MVFSNIDIIISLITLILLISIVYFKVAKIRYMTIGLYILFSIYVYYNVDKRYSLGMLSLFILTYMFVAEKPVMEHFNDDENVEKDEIEDSLENPELVSIDEDELSQEKEEEQEKDVDEQIVNKEEELEKGVQQFGIDDKFSQLHGLLHKITEQAKKGNH